MGPEAIIIGMVFFGIMVVWVVIKGYDDYE